jgi:hypothetical protein
VLPRAPPQVLPQGLNQILIIVVALSMALTPVLAEAGSRLAAAVEARWPEEGPTGDGGAAVEGASAGAGGGSGGSGVLEAADVSGTPDEEKSGQDVPRARVFGAPQERQRSF